MATVEKVTTTFISDKQTRNLKKDGGGGASRHAGVGNKVMREMITSFASTEVETVMRGSTNCFIVLGKDRNAGDTSGYGGIGASGASCIDLFAGHMGDRPTIDINGVQVPAGKDFINDSARVYISQLADVDSYFQIPKFQMKLGSHFLDIEQSRMASTIASKADTIRVIARENIKLVTFHKGLSSKSKETYDGGIDIIAGCNAVPYDNSLSLQPMVKGDNLRECLKFIIDKIEDLRTTTNSFILKQIDFNSALSKHVHQSGEAGYVTSDMVENDTGMASFEMLTYLLPQMLLNKVSIITESTRYLDPLNEKFINSNFNRVN